MEIFLFLKHGIELFIKLINDTFSFINSPAEEFALQTISMNLDEPIYYIGNGFWTTDKVPPNDFPFRNHMKFTYKVKRD